MKIILLCILLQVCTPQYEFKSTSPYKPITNRYEMTQETPNNPNNNANRPGPKKVSGIDGLAWWILWGSVNGVPSSATNEQMYAYYNYIQNGGTLSYNDWLNSQSVPIQEPDVTLVLCLALLYLIVIERKKQRKSRNEPI